MAYREAAQQGGGLEAFDVEAEIAALKSLSEVHGLPAIDLNQLCLRLDQLDVLPRSVAEEQRLLPVLVRGDRLYVAMASPSDRALLSALAERTGKEVSPYVALPAQLVRVIPAAYDARDAGRSHFVGPTCPPRLLEKAGLGPGGEPLGALSSAAAAPAREARGEGPARSVRGPRVLLADSDAERRAQLSSRLGASGFRVQAAALAAEVLDLVADHDFAAIVLAEQLTDEHGLELASRLRARASGSFRALVLLSERPRSWAYAADLCRVHGLQACLSQAEAPAALGELLERLLGLRTAGDLSEEARGLRSRAQAYFEAGDVEGATELLEEALALGVPSAELLLDLGLLRARAGRWYEAASSLEAAVEHASTQASQASPLRNLALVYERLGMASAAGEAWLRLLAIAPEGPHAAQARARVALGG